VVALLRSDSGTRAPVAPLLSVEPASLVQTDAEQIARASLHFERARRPNPAPNPRATVPMPPNTRPAVRRPLPVADAGAGFDDSTAEEVARARLLRAGAEPSLATEHEAPDLARPTKSARSRRLLRDPMPRTETRGCRDPPRRVCRPADRPRGRRRPTRALPKDHDLPRRVLANAEPGLMVAFQDPFPADWDLLFKHDGDIFWVVDRCCPTHSCNCSSVALTLCKIRTDNPAPLVVGDADADLAQESPVLEVTTPAAREPFAALSRELLERLLLRREEARRAALSHASTGSRCVAPSRSRTLSIAKIPTGLMGGCGLTSHRTRSKVRQRVRRKRI